MWSKVRTALSRRQVQIGAAVVVAAAAAGVAAWLLLDDEKDGERTEPVPASVSELRTLARSVGHSVYWVGPRRGYTYELTKTPEGKVFIRYLPPGVRLGDRRAIFLSIGTYPYENPLRKLRRDARLKNRVITREIPRGGLAVAYKARPESVYLAYGRGRGISDLLLEVYDRSAARARRLATSGRVVPVR